MTDKRYGIELTHDRSDDAGALDADCWVASAWLDGEVVTDVAAPTTELALSALAGKLLYEVGLAWAKAETEAED